jgi:DNA-binding NarL/FixJ family response regulator
MRRQHILLVDDHALVRDSLLMLLAQRIAGLNLAGVGSLAEAIAHVQERPRVDLVLLDLDLPDSGGLDTLDRFRAAAPHLPVVVLSAHDGHEQVLAAIDRGAAGYLCKTADADALTQAVRQVVQGGVAIPDHARASHTLGLAFSNLLSGRPEVSLTALDPGLSERQRDVLRLLVEGKPNKQISRELGVTEATVKTHLQAVFRRLEVCNRTQAVMAVARLGLTL